MRLIVVSTAGPTHGRPTPWIAQEGRKVTFDLIDGTFFCQIARTLVNNDFGYICVKGGNDRSTARLSLQQDGGCAFHISTGCSQAW